MELPNILVTDSDVLSSCAIATLETEQASGSGDSISLVWGKEIKEQRTFPHHT